MTKDDLEGLIKNPAWVELCRQERERWRDNLESPLASAANDTNDLLALQKIRQVIAAKRAVEAIIDWPSTQLKKFGDSERRHTAEPSVTRGGFR